MLTLIDPAIPPILKRLLAMDTPVALRILELGLFGLLMWGCAFCMEHDRSQGSETHRHVLVRAGRVYRSHYAH
jgi:hypothetical protein